MTEQAAVEGWKPGKTAVTEDPGPLSLVGW
jgi:hypothetical protein